MNPCSAISTPPFLTQTSVFLDSANSTGNDFGFAPAIDTILDDLNPEDPDNDGFTFVGSGKTIGYWKHQLAVGIRGRGRAHVDVEKLAEYLVGIEDLYLATPFQFADGFDDAYAILKSTSSDKLDLLKKQLLGLEFNEVAGKGLTGDYEALQSTLVAWGEYLAAHDSDYTREELLAAKDIFDGINNTGE